MPDLGGLGASLTEVEADYNVYKIGSQYYARDKVGTVISNSSFASLMGSIDTALGSAGGSIIIKRGTYDITSDIVMANPIDIYGKGLGKTILRRVLNLANKVGFKINASNVTIASLTFDGNYTANALNDQSELQLAGNNITVINVEVKDFTNIGITAFGSGESVDGCIITGANVANKSYMGIWSDLAASTEVNVTRSRFTNCYYNGVFLGGRSIVANCFFEANAVTSGGQIAYGDTCTIGVVDHNIIVNGQGDATNGAAGVECSHQGTTGGDWIITGNYISNQPQWGIVANGLTIAPNSLIIKNNIVRNCGRDGIMIHESISHFVVEGNLCYDDQGVPTQDQGIVLTPGTGNDNYVIRNNICWNNTVAQIVDLGTGNTKEVAGNIPLAANVGRNLAGASVVTDSAQTLTGKTLSSSTNYGIMTDPQAKRVGWFEPSGGTTATTVGSVGGALGSHVPTGPGITNAVVWDTTEGLIANLVTTNTINQNAGILSPTGAAFCRTLFGGKVKARFKVDAVATAVSRVYFGVIGASAIPISDTPMASGVPGVLFGFASADTVYRVYHNDAAGAAVNDAFTGSIAKNTSFHDIEINWAAGATSVNVIFDGTTMNIATAIPATTDNLWFHCTVQNATAAIRTASYKGVWVEFDK